MKVINILFIILLFVSCKKDLKTDKEIRERIFSLENRGWKTKTHIQKIDKISYQATEVPIEYYLLKENGKEDLFKIDSIYQNTKNERIFEFEFEQEDSFDLLKEEFTSISYEDGIKYLSFHIDKDFYVVNQKKDTIKCDGVLFERNFKLNSKQKVILFFSNVAVNDELQLVYKDKLFNKGTLKFNLKNQKFTEILL